MLDREKLIIEVVDDKILIESDNGNFMDKLNMMDDEIVGVDLAAMVPEVGFPVRKRNSKKEDDGVVRYMTLTCSREGRRISNTNVSSKSLHRYNQELSAHVKRWLEVNGTARIPLHKSYNSVVVKAGGYKNMTCIEKDYRNHVKKVRHLKLGEGDAAAIQSYFSSMQARFSSFYFSMDLDDELCLEIFFFWANNMCRQAYEEFGDVVTFDTTYLTKKYDMPFAPFVGANHHGQSTLLGCGLASNENSETFVWLFKTWLQCMQGQSSSGIIMDQHRAMQNVIHIVFPFRNSFQTQNIDGACGTY
ncbi:protein FAR-RED IMPAIRED RESPONSE 1-like [Olea europaea var. sylvestris]|uniref:protein FAR-RED IMPAIRED RESPONSE 1-like n=1 Tax=Olea europaea var. sylvestris TaxID=158386 RepID=UPI000C1D6FBF|nr:protein FAR-RED IMPAIRED RESPONSE 1-like [Olea europaea var. sylvestris]